jgi:adenylate cyclase
LERRLTTILALDVVGYSRLMAVDEARTLEQLKKHRKELIEPKTSQYRGRVVKLMGDGTLMEFGSVVDAVNFAVDVQRSIAKHNSGVPEEWRLSYRIGINIGDVISDGDDIYGDGVNMAARLEGLAETGGICVARNVFDQVNTKIDITFEDLGAQAVKNIPKPVQVYRVLLDIAGRKPGANASAKYSLRWPIAVSVIIALLAVTGIALWQRPWEPGEEHTLEANMTFALPDKPSIAVLPFNNMSQDADQEYFADGMTEDLITDLSNISGLFVIARNSSFSYKGQQVKIHQVAEELGVRYVLEGSVRRVGNEVRINAQLIDTTTGGHLWAKRYDGTLDDIFKLQDQVTEQIVAALSINLTSGEQAHQSRRSTQNIAAHDAFLQGWTQYKLSTPKDLARAIPFFDEAIGHDPDYSLAHAALASAYWDAYRNNWAFNVQLAAFEAEERADKHLELALKSPTPLAYVLQSRISASDGFYDRAVEEAEKAITLDGNDATAHAGLADVLVLAGHPAEAIVPIRTAMRLDPHHPPAYLSILGATQFGIKSYAEAASTFERAIKRNPDNELPLIYLASSYGHLGWIEDADDTIETVNDLRNKIGMGELSIRPGGAIASYGFDKWGLDFERFGSKAVQDHIRTGLIDIPALKWQYLIIRHPQEVKGATYLNVDNAKPYHGKGVIFIDLSDKSTWMAGHIPGAVHLSRGRSQDLNQERFTKKTLQNVAGIDDEIVLYFDDGSAAYADWEAAKAVTWGYRKVYFFNGGAKAWKNAGYPIEAGQ